MLTGVGNTPLNPLLPCKKYLLMQNPFKSAFLAKTSELVLVGLKILNGLSILIGTSVCNGVTHQPKGSLPHPSFSGNVALLLLYICAHGKQLCGRLPYVASKAATAVVLVPGFKSGRGENFYIFGKKKLKMESISESAFVAWVYAEFDVSQRGKKVPNISRDENGKARAVVAGGKKMLLQWPRI